MKGPVPSSTRVRFPRCAATNLAELTVRKLAITARKGAYGFCSFITIVVALGVETEATPVKNEAHGEAVLGSRSRARLAATSDDVIVLHHGRSRAGASGKYRFYRHC